MLRPILATLLTGATLLGATAAQAETRWSIGINLPAAGIIVSDSPRYYEPTPVYYAPAPVVHYAPPRYVQRDVYYAPPPRVVYETSYRDRRWEGRHDHGHSRRDHDRHDRNDRHDRDGHRDYGPQRGR